MMFRCKMITLTNALLLGCVIPASLAGSPVLRASSAENHSGTIDVGGRPRTYFVHPPPGYTGKARLPLVFVLHGANQSPEIAERMSGMSAKADQENFIAVYPSGTGRISSALTWNSGACCGYAMENKVDDVAFFRVLIEKLEKEYSVDPQRIFATGISNGAMMSYRLACELSGKIAAIASVEGSQRRSCHPANLVSVIVFQGTEAHLEPRNDASTSLQASSIGSAAPVAETIAFWANYDGCSSKPKRAASAELRSDIYSDCLFGTAVALYVIRGEIHTWPVLRESHNSVPATDLIWAFFQNHPKQ